MSRPRDIHDRQAAHFSTAPGSLSELPSWQFHAPPWPGQTSTRGLGGLGSFFGLLLEALLADNLPGEALDFDGLQINMAPALDTTLNPGICFIDLFALINGDSDVENLFQASMKDRMEHLESEKKALTRFLKTTPEPLLAAAPEPVGSLSGQGSQPRIRIEKLRPQNIGDRSHARVGFRDSDDPEPGRAER